MAEQLNDRLEEYGAVLDDAAAAYLREKESGVVLLDARGMVKSRRSTRVLGAVAATAALVVGSFVVNQFGNGSGAGRQALAWSATPRDSSGSQRQKVINACTTARPDGTDLSGATVAVDVRGSLGIHLRVTNSMAAICVATIDSDIPKVAVLQDASTVEDVRAGVQTDMTGVQIANVRVAGSEIIVVWGRDDVLPEDCRNLDVFTSKGVIRAVRASGVFAFWYPGPPSFSGMNANSIKYGCAVDGSEPGANGATPSSIPGADVYANLCVATITVLQDHGIIGQTGKVINLAKWDMEVYDEFKNKLTPIAEVLAPGNGRPLSGFYAAWTGVNEGGMFALDKSGAQKITDKAAVEAEVTEAINTFVAQCDDLRTRPEDRTATEATALMTVTPTTIQIREMTPSVLPTQPPPG